MTLFDTIQLIIDNINFYLTYELNFISISFRLVLALILGASIGIDREKKRQSAGVRTHSLVCVGSALVMLTGLFVYDRFGSTIDVSRMGAQVISGVGFLGVGTIIVSNNKKVRGLTTAAGLWTCACIGLAVGVGFYFGGVLTGILATFLLKVLNRIDRVLISRIKEYNFYLEFKNLEGIRNLENYLESKNFYITDFQSVQAKNKDGAIGIEMAFSVNDNNELDDMIKFLKNNNSINFYHRIYL